MSLAETEVEIEILSFLDCLHTAAIAMGGLPATVAIRKSDLLDLPAGKVLLFLFELERRLGRLGVTLVISDGPANIRWS